MKLYAIKFQNEAIKENDWFKSLGCAISSITHFDGRVVECVVISSTYIGAARAYSNDWSHSGMTGMALKLWWATDNARIAKATDDAIRRVGAELAAEGGAA